MTIIRRISEQSSLNGEDVALNEQDEEHLEEVELALLRMETGHTGPVWSAKGDSL